MGRLKQNIAELNDEGEGWDSELSDRDKLIARQYEADKENKMWT